MIDFPREPASRESLDAAWGIRVVRALRALFPSGGPGVRVATGPGGTTISADPATAPAARPPMPFDCRLGTVGTGESAETHAFCHLPDRDSGLVSVYRSGAEHSVGRIVLPDGASVRDDWLDLGEISVGDVVTLMILVDNAGWGMYKETCVLRTDPRYAVRIGSAPPSGYHLAGPVAPSVVLAKRTQNGLRQLFRGRYRSDRAQADTAVGPMSGDSSESPRPLSIDNGHEGMLLLHGFRRPTVVANPYAGGTGGTGGTGDANDYLLLVRVVTGSTAELKYIKLSDLAAADPSGDGSPPPPPEYQDIADDYHDRVDLPCPTDHDLKTPLIYFWNPCDLTDAQGNVLQPAGWQQGQFWPTGGNASQCKGASIGDSNGNVVINQDTRTLTGGTWNFAAGFSVQNVPFVRKNLSVDGSVRVDVLATTAPSGTIPSLASHEALTNLAGRVSAAETSLSGLETLLSQI